MFFGLLAAPAEVGGVADPGGTPAHRRARVVEHGGQLVDSVWVATRDVPNIGMSRDQSHRGLSRSADPDRRVGLLQRLRIRDRVLEVVVAPLEVRALLGE